MPFALWVAAASFAVMTVVLLSVVWPRGLIVVGLAALAAAAVGAVLAAETPFGIGDGVVPDVRGLEQCEALPALEARGLRWRHADGPVRSHVPGELGCGDVAQEDEITSNPIVRQQPAPGTRLGEGGVVRLRYACEPPGCGLG